MAGVLLDGAHNPDGASALASALPALHPDRPVELVFGVLADKDHRGMLAAIAPAVRGMHLVAPRSPRARATATYRDLASGLVPAAHEHGSVVEAIACARQAAGANGLVCVAGSLYLVGEARALLVG